MIKKDEYLGSNLLTTMVYIAQLRAAASESMSPNGRISNPSPWLKITHPTPINAIIEPTIVPALMDVLNMIDMSIVVNIGEIEDNNDTLDAIVFCRAKFSVMKYSEPAHIPHIRKFISSRKLSDRIFLNVKHSKII